MIGAQPCTSFIRLVKRPDAGTVHACLTPSRSTHPSQPNNLLAQALSAPRLPRYAAARVWIIVDSARPRTGRACFERTLFRTRWLSPSTIAKIPGRRVAEVALGQPQHLLAGEGFDVSSDVGHDLGGDVFAVLFDVRHPVVRGVRPALPVPQQQDRSGRGKRVTDRLPIL